MNSSKHNNNIKIEFVWHTLKEREPWFWLFIIGIRNDVHSQLDIEFVFYTIFEGTSNDRHENILKNGKQPYYLFTFLPSL